MISIRARNGTNEGTMMHLFGKLRENFTDLNSVRTSGNGIEFTLRRPARLGIPSIDMTHSASVPEENDVLGLHRTVFPSGA
jgi:hypothetical protein